MTDRQTQLFRPDLYFDIESVRDLKKKELDRHQSQRPDAIWEAHDAMHRRRGAECGVTYAEGYVQASQRQGRLAIPLSVLSPRK